MLERNLAELLEDVRVYVELTRRLAAEELVVDGGRCNRVEGHALDGRPALAALQALRLPTLVAVQAATPQTRSFGVTSSVPSGPSMPT